MRQIQFLSLLFFFFPTLLSAQIKTVESKDELIKWETLQEKNYSVEFPVGWELDTSRQRGTTFVLLSPKNGEEIQFRSNINLLVQDLKGREVNLNEYTAMTKTQIAQYITDYNIISNTLIEEEGKHDSQHMIYTGRQGIRTLRFEQRYWVIGNKAYVLTFTCPLNEYSSLQNITNGILKSFTLIKNN